MIDNIEKELKHFTYAKFAQKLYKLKKDHLEKFNHSSNNNISCEKLLNDYMSHLFDESVIKNYIGKYYIKCLKTILNNYFSDQVLVPIYNCQLETHMLNILWDSDKHAFNSFEKILDKTNFYNIQRLLYKDTEGNYLNSDELIFLNLIIVYFAYFKFILTDKKMITQYIKGCKKYSKEDYSDINPQLHTKHENIRIFLYDVASEGINTKRKYASGFNSRSPHLSVEQYICFTILFTMFDNDKKIITTAKKQNWEFLEQYEQSLILFIAFYLDNEKELYFDISNKINDSLKAKTIDKLKSIFYKIDFLNENDRNICLNNFYKKYVVLKKNT